MGKSKAQRKQEKKTSMQEVKKAQEIKVKEKKVEEETKGTGVVKSKEGEPQAQPIKHVGPEQVKLTMYTLISMIVTFISAGVTAVAMVVYAKPLIYVLQVTVGDTFNDYSLEAVEQLIFEDDPSFGVYELYLGVALLLAIGAIVTVIGMIKAVNEFNKPNMTLTIVGLVFSVAALALFLWADSYTKDTIRSYGFQEQPVFNIYSLYLPFLITNVVAMVCNIFATANGLKRWKKTGRTSK